MSTQLLGFVNKLLTLTRVGDTVWQKRLFAVLCSKWNIEDGTE